VVYGVMGYLAGVGSAIFGMTIGMVIRAGRK